MSSSPVSSIMSKNVVCVTPHQKLIDVKHIYEKKEFHHHIPVTEDERLVGMISLIDFMYKIKGAGLDDNHLVYNELTAKDIMTPNPFALDEHVSIDEVAHELSKGNYHAIPIVEGKKVIGIVSTADIIKYYLNKNNTE
ncbi:CBS domain-containing protein [Tamlana flava]|uniref:CBS domain-containing protein n=1 Tax=Tamlana flava TaxID=3158572 RepID=UPI00351BAA64